MELAGIQSTPQALPPRQRPDTGAIPVLLRAAWLQALRQNEIVVLLLLLGLYAAAAVIVRLTGTTGAQSARFVLGLGLQLGSVLSGLLVVALGVRALPPEIEQRTIYPVLAKPLHRSTLLLGKALPVWLVGMGSLILFVIAARLLSPALPDQDPFVLLQATGLKCCALLVLTALSLAVSLLLPVSVAMLVAGAVALLSGTLCNLAARLWPPLGDMLPDLSVLDQFGRYAEGGPVLTPMAICGLLLYAVLWTCIFGWLAQLKFKRMPL